MKSNDNKQSTGRRKVQGATCIEAEARQILIEATRSHQGLGSTLAAIGRRLGGVDIAPSRDQQPLEPASFE